MPSPLRRAELMGIAVTYGSADMARAPPDDGRRYEVVHAELLVPLAHSHADQRAVTRLVTALSRYLEAQRIGEVLRNQPRFQALLAQFC